jgi:predicted MFS family arabinose efflux permease
MSRNLRLVSLSLLLWGVGESLWIYLEPLYLQQLGASPFQVGTVLGLGALAMTVAHLPAGALADHLGRRSLMVAAWLVGLVSAMLMFAASDLTLFAAAVVLYSFTAFVNAPLFSYITAARGSWTVSKALTTVGALSGTGAIIGALAGGLIAERMGIRTLYGLSIVLFLFSTAAVLPTGGQPVEPAEGVRRYGSLLANRPLIARLGLLFLGLFAMYLSWPLAPNFLQDQRGISLGLIGAFGSINALGLVVSNFLLGRINPTAAFTCTLGMSAFSALLLWQGTGAPWFALAYLLAAGYRTGRIVGIAQVESLVAPSQLGLTYGMVETLFGLTLALGAPAAGLLYRHNPALPFPTAIGLILVVLILIVLTGRRHAARP